ncbi:hypothetical protein BGX34_006496 [Mortierella sp. NVP85]|nr:hypothetical protein BGX34_006496 [Mortierella sp. NVP85]
MVATQSFRVLGKQDIEEITCEEMFGENVIYWEDIEQVFPGVMYVKHGTTTYNMMRDLSRKRFVPFCIKHCPDVVLDIVLSAPGDPVVDSNSSGGYVQTGVLASGASPFDDPPETTLTSPTFVPPHTPFGFGTTLDDAKPLEKATPSLESEIDQHF